MKTVDVHIHTNTMCNLKCLHCYESTGNTDRAVLSDDFEIVLIRYLCKNFNADIHLEGGEIFLEEHLITSLSVLDKSILRHLTITTNGTLCLQNNDVLQVLYSVGCLRISVEGHTDYLHQTVRGIELQPVLENALYFQSQGVPVVLRLTLNSLNADTMFSETIPALEAKGFSRFQIYELQPVGRGKTSGICISTRLDKFFDNWFKHPSGSSVKVFLPLRRMSESSEYLMRLNRIGVVVEDTGNVASLNIGADGSVRVCPWDTTSEPILFLSKDNIETLNSVLDQQNIPHECNFCSRIVLRADSPC